MSKLSLAVLGSFEAWLDGRRLERFRTKSVQALLIYLACEREHIHRREHLMALLWPGLPQTSAQHNLRQTLYVLRKTIPEVEMEIDGETGSFLLADRTSIQINPDAGFELDGARFESLLAGPLEGWPAAVDLYRGDFLTDFYLPDSEPFEEWALARREAYRRQTLDALERLATDALSSQDLAGAEAYARRQIEIDNLHETGHRQLMRSLALTGKRTDALAHYNTLRLLLEEELGADPSADTIGLYESILAGKTTIVAEPREDTIAATVETTPEDFDEVFPLSGPSPPQPLFVGRSRALVSLEGSLDEALEGNGRTIFVEGSAGSGKSMLLTELTRRALEAHPDLLVAAGASSAFAGVGDPYLCFRELMALLTGDLESSLEAGTITRSQAQRLWLALPETTQTLLEVGPDLLDVFVSGKRLLVRAQSAASGSTQWLVRLKEQVARSRPTDLEQRALFSQFGDFLFQLSKSHPLLILLDDLHWADDGSLGLLFYLGRHLAGSRILLGGAYRPEGLTGERASQRHPLQEVLGELQRTYGDITVDLAAMGQDEGRTFIEALLDAEPNRFDQAFRDAFYRQTAGHPLFSVELLHEMQRRGDVIQDDVGQWYEGIAVDWQTLPSRVEAVIGQRLGHLDQTSRDLLEVASVEGQTFTAEVVAEVSHTDLHEIVVRISRSLVRQHRLLNALGIKRLSPDGRQITQYRFQHHLFQAYLYQELDEIERSYLHQAVGLKLETLYLDQLDEIADQLARHFLKAGEWLKALEYLHLASRRAAKLLAFDEAIDGYKRALALVEISTNSDIMRQNKYQLYMGLAEAQRKAGHFGGASESFQHAAAIARNSGSAEDLARAALGYEKNRWRFNLPVEPSQALLEEALGKLEPTENILWVRVWINLARTRMVTSPPDQVESMLQQALEMARRVNDPLSLYEAFYLNVRGNRRPESSDERLAMLAEMVQLAETIGSYELFHEGYGFRLLEYLERGEIEAFVADEQRYVAPLATKMRQPFYDYLGITYKAVSAMLAGRFAEAEQLVGQALELGRQMQVENYDGVYSMQMFTIRREQGRLHEFAPVVRMFISQNPAAAIWRPGLALMYAEIGMLSEAQVEFEALAQDDFADLHRDALWVTSVVYLSEVCAHLGDRQRAAILYELLRPYDGRNIVVGFNSCCLGAAARYLALLTMTMSDWEAAEDHFEDALAMNERMGAWPWLARTQFEYGKMLLAHGHALDQDRALDLLATALETADKLGMAALVAEIEAQNDDRTVNN